MQLDRRLTDGVIGGEFWLCPSSPLIMRQVKEGAEPVSFPSVPPPPPSNKERERLCVCMWQKVKDGKFGGVRNKKRGSTGGVEMKLLLLRGHFSLFVFHKKGDLFSSFQGPRVRKPCESNSCCFLFSKQKARTHWKLIHHSGAVVKWNGCRGMSQFFSEPRQFVASGKNSPTRREYLMAALLVWTKKKGGKN